MNLMSITHPTYPSKVCQTPLPAPRLAVRIGKPLKECLVDGRFLSDGAWPSEPKGSQASKKLPSKGP